jgi:hypothetical protein
MRSVLLCLLFSLVVCALSGALAWGADPVIAWAHVYRSWDLSPQGVVSYHEMALAAVNDEDGRANIESITVTDSRGVRRFMWPVVTWPTGMRARWGRWNQSAAPHPGPYTFEVRDFDGNSDSITTATTDPVPEHPPENPPLELLEPPRNNSVITDTVPVFCWRDETLAEYGSSLHLWEGVPPETALWSRGVGEETCVVYNDDGTALQPELNRGSTHFWIVVSTHCYDAGASDPRVSLFTQYRCEGIFTLAVYQIQWVPLLHDGTSIDAPDGPFKAGRTLPVKFRLLDAEGQPVSDEIAQTLVAELRVFYEAPANQGVPIDPGDNPPDSGDQFRYDAEDDLFIFNLSTKDPAWLPNYTYGVDVLIDDVKTGEVFFSLR